MANGQKAFGGQSLFADATFAINEGEHVGVIGPNGAGKTTLFKILVEAEHLDDGRIIRSQSLRIGYLSQHDVWEPGETGNAYLERVATSPLWEAKAQGRALQMSEALLEVPITSLSGGYRMRIKLLGLLSQSPNLMLLDEPTNYLDLETTLLLERFLQNYDGAFLLISHDREFLRRTTDHILEIEAGDITKYNGHIDDYFEQKELLRQQLAAQAAAQADKRKAVLDFVNRFGAKATKARQAQSRLRSLEKMETIELKSVPVSAAIQIPEPSHVGREVVRLAGVALGYGEKVILRDVNLSVARGDHLAVVGLNGAGKSTLLKGLAGTLAPLSGQRELGHQVSLAIFNQHVAEILNPSHTFYDALADAAHASITPQEIRNMAGSLLFSSDHINKKVSVLSGGEKSRVALGQILLKKAPCLLLDEPTNHLDFHTVEALTQALKKFTGTIITVSHDRGFIRRVASKILEISDGVVRLYPGTYDEYVWSLQRRLAEESGTAAKDSKPIKPDVPAEKTLSYAEKKERDRRLRQIERRISQVETQLSELAAKIHAANEKISAGDTSAEVIRQLSEDSASQQDLEAEWLRLEEERNGLI